MRTAADKLWALIDSAMLADRRRLRRALRAATVDSNGSGRHGGRGPRWTPQRVEAEIRHELDSPVPLIQEMGGYIAGAGGKRLRPMLLLLAARLAGYTGPRSVRLACVVEMLHTATLIHDDVVDQAPLRRGRPSANAQWGDDASVLVGDHLYAKSFAMLSPLSVVASLPST